MVVKKSSLFGIIAIIVGASGLGLGAFSIINYQLIEGPEGPQGDDGQNGIDGLDGTDGINGTDGKDAPGGFIVRILDPDYGETILNNITIRVLVYGSEHYSISILLNGTEIGTTLPVVWDTNTVPDGCWNITAFVTDSTSGNTTQDQVLIYVKNTIEGYEILSSLYITGNIWLDGTINWGTARGRVLNGARIDIGIGSTTNEEIFSLTLINSNIYSSTYDYIIHIRWRLIALTSDCDPILYIEDGVGNQVGIAPQDNDGGTMGIMNQSIQVSSSILGGGYPEDIDLYFHLNQNNLFIDWCVYSISNDFGIEMLNNRLDISDGLTVRVLAGDASEEYGFYSLLAEIIKPN